METKNSCKKSFLPEALISKFWWGTSKDERKVSLVELAMPREINVCLRHQ